MRTALFGQVGRSRVRGGWFVLVGMACALLVPGTSAAQSSPWERAAANLEASFTGPLARSLALVAIVIGGLMFMFGEGGAKRQISGIVFGGGLACSPSSSSPGCSDRRRRTHGRHEPPRVSRRVSGAASPADRVRRRSAPVLPGAPGRRRQRSICSTASSPGACCSPRSTPSRCGARSTIRRCSRSCLRSGHGTDAGTTPRSTSTSTS